MENTRLPIQDDFEKRLATLAQRAEELVRQAVALRVFVEHWRGGNLPAGYGKDPESGFLEEPGRFPGMEQGKRVFSRLAEDLARSLSELDEQADALAGQERGLTNAHGALKDLTEEINALTLAVEDTLQGKKAALTRVTGLTREIAVRTQNVKRRQESLSGAIQEAVRTMENKDQELLAVLEQMKPGIVFGDRHLEQLKDILQTQDELLRLLGDQGRSRSPETGPPENRDGVATRVPAYLQILSATAQETAQDLSRLHQGLRSIKSGPWGEQWDRVVAEIAPCRRTLEELKKNLKAPEGTAGTAGAGSSGDPETEGLWESLSGLNEKITLLALKASLNAFHKGKKPEDLIKVLEEIRDLSAQVNQVLLSWAEGRHRTAGVLPAGSDPNGRTADNPRWVPFLERWYTLLAALETAGPAIDRLKGAAAEHQRFEEKLLSDLTRIVTQCQGLTSLFQDQALAEDSFSRSTAAGPQAARRLQKIARTQEIQLQELNRNLQNVWSQVRPLRKIIQGAGLGYRALSGQLEEMREVVDSQGHELLIQGAKGEQLVKALEGLRAFLENLERLLPTQSHRQNLLRDSAGKIDSTAKKMNQTLEEQRQLVDGLAGQARQAVQQYGPLVQAHREQSSLAATLLEALAEIHQLTGREILRQDKPPRDDLSS
jgi:methyl-accepting chemotaxis protein